jgi:hypothetical protein
MYKFIYPIKTNNTFTINIPVHHCTLLLTILLHDRLDNVRTMEGQMFRLSTALILPQLNCDSR